MVALVITDIHANLAALRAVVRAAAGRFEEVWCLGDVVGYGPEPKETLAEVRQLRPVAIAGNHDRGATGRLDLATFSAGARDALERHGPLLDPDEKGWLASLPSHREHQSVTLCHGSLADPVWGYILSGDEAEDTIARARTSVVFTGHTHYPAIWRQTPAGVELVHAVFSTPMSLRDGMCVVNPGSVGQPRNGTPAAHYALFDTRERVVTFERVSYPYRKTMKKMRRLGYPEPSVARYALGK